MNVISASWNFDFQNNKVIGIREVYVKQGHGTLTEMKNLLAGTQYNSILQLTKPDERVDTIFLKNERPEDLHVEGIRALIDENSFLFKDSDDSTVKKVPPTELKSKK